MRVEQFCKVLKDFAAKHVPAQVALMERKIALEGLRRLVMKTPVDTGRARGGWQVTIGEMVMTVRVYRQAVGGSMGAAFVTAYYLDRSGEDTISTGSEVIEQITTPVRCVIGNTVEYIEALEHGHSQQAPNGMLGLTVDELGQTFK